ncbi:MAG: hypothetical protein WCI31_10055 [Prolixibacteraceae bacterium]
MAEQKLTLKELADRYSSLDERLNRIEAQLAAGARVANPVRAAAQLSSEEQEVDFTNPLSESKVFEHGLAWIGSAVLLLGMMFTMLFVNNAFGGITSFILGISSAALTFFLSGLLKKSLSYMAFMFTICAHLLIYYALLRLHFFTENPVLSNLWLTIVLMLGSVSFLMYKADVAKSQLMGFIAYFLLILTALLTDQTQVTLALFVVGTAAVLYFLNRNGWDTLLILSIFMVYIGHTIWLIGNPLMGHPASAVVNPQFNLFYLFLYGAIYSVVPFLKQNGKISAEVCNATIILNSIAFSVLLMLIVLTFYTKSYIFIFLAISIGCLLYAILLNYKVDSRFDSFFYVNFGFMALSIAVYGNSDLPGSFLFLAWQSMVVLAIAIWFRSNLIVLMNTALFTIILIAYLIMTKSIDSYNISFTFIAIASARILNWQQNRLELKTGSIRSFYLVITFFVMLYTLYNAVAIDYVTISWGLAAVAYMIMSVILKNIKYRWLAFLTLLAAVVHLFMFDISKMGVGYRIVAFIFVGLTILGVSFYYTKKLKSGKNEEIAHG